ncbi:NADH-quinone oxidoreductase subunit N [Acidomonas methanolica]|uniref:NADH-quinone oxidoreductase subunit N n=1 Tax=Acidomonas methanolica TaxID=437 RepID=UPI00211A3D90|nr:NADH-quinone oxidoreductase subunit N [Acidomonas methanolica]MCQ9155673.1 NADH-quinone oxidoreductase subunit N [Acidomonas methanolica]
MDSFSFLPNAVLVLCAGSLVQMAAIAIRRNVAQDAVLGLVVLLASLAVILAPTALVLTGTLPLFAPDAWASYTAALVILSAIAIHIMSWRNSVLSDTSVGSEYYLLLTLATLGGVVMSSAIHDVSFFIGLEILSLAMFGLIAFRNARIDAGEAAMKYLVLSGLSSAMLLMGFALTFAETGSLRFLAPVATNAPEPLLASMGVILVLTGMFFKLSAVPFHLWLADVLEGTSIPVAALVAVLSKIGLFAAMVRYFSSINLYVSGPQVDEIVVVAVLSMIGGNLLAVAQTNIKRMLAGSSIAHIGYLLVAFLSPGPFSFASAAFYLAAYAIATLGIFAIIAGVMPQGSYISDWYGMFRRKPVVAFAMSVMLLSLAGIPPSVGFFAKFYIVAAGISAHRVILLLVLIAGSTISLFYYLRLILVMILPRPSDSEAHRQMPPITTPWVGNRALIALLAVATILLGVFPSRLVQSGRQLLDVPPPPGPSASP